MDGAPPLDKARDPAAAMPPGDVGRLSALARYSEWDVEGGEGFEDIVRLAALICRAPMASVGFIGDGTIRHKAVFGVERPAKLDVRDSFSHIVVERAALVVMNDATRDPDFCDNRYVTGEPHLRFCAGVPLLSEDGLAMGALCVFDLVPRDLTDEAALSLQALGRQCVSQLELRRSLKIEREAEEQLGLIFDSATDYAIMALDPDGAITRWNEGAQRIFGWSAADAHGQPIAIVFTAADRAAGLPGFDLRKAAEHGREIDERYYERKNRAQFWGTGETMPIRDGDGAIRGYLKILRDRTTQKRVKEALEYQTGVLQAITDHLAEALFQVDVDHRVTFMNPAAEAMFGWSRYELIGVNLHDRLHYVHADGTAFHRDDCPYVVALKSRAAIGHRPDMFVHRDGRPIDVIVSFTPIVTDGQVTGAVMTLTDVTERKKTEEVLRATQERFQLAVAASDIVGSWDLDLVGKTIIADATLAEQYGIDPGAAAQGVARRQFAMAIHDEDRERVIAAMRHSVATGGRFAEEYRLARPDGSVRWVSAHGRCHFDASGQPVRFPGLSVDITDRKRGEERRSALLDLEDRLRNEETLPAIAGLATELLCRLLAVQRAGYGLFDDSGTHLTIEAEHDAVGTKALEGTHSLEGYGSYGAAIRQGSVIVIDDVMRNTSLSDDRDRWRASGIGAVVNVPLIAEGRLSALFFVHSASPRRWTQEDVALIANVADRTWAAISRARSAALQKILTGELHHRIKNTLTMVLAIANQTMRKAATKEDAFSAFEARIFALSEAQNILTRASWTSASMATIVGGALAPHRPLEGDRIHVEGPDVGLSAQTALSFALALHELATNATKYGALSNETGIVSIVWSVEQAGTAPTLHFEWRERGGPPVVAPTTKGFGTRLIKGGFARSVTVAIDYAPDGLRCRFDAPLHGI
jgi:PAS domain S-box-containing protein